MAATITCPSKLWFIYGAPIRKYKLKIYCGKIIRFVWAFKKKKKMRSISCPDSMIESAELELEHIVIFINPYRIKWNGLFIMAHIKSGLFVAFHKQHYITCILINCILLIHWSECTKQQTNKQNNSFPRFEECKEKKKKLFLYYFCCHSGR